MTLQLICVAMAGLALCGTLAAAPRSAVYTVLDYGAVGDGTTNNTAAINAAVKAAAGAGGGTVYVPPGTYLTGTIRLLDNTTLHVERGAKILGSTDYRDYEFIPPPIETDRLEYARYALIAAVNARNVAIVGGGTVNGQGYHDAWSKDAEKAGRFPKPANYSRYLDRPFGFAFQQCRGVTVRDVRLEEAGFWCQGYLDCDDVLIDGVTVESPKHGTNNDGIDVDGSRRVTISNCRINAGDDGICLKASYRDCENITITNCVVASTSNGIKFGTASNGGFKGIAISNCAIYNTSNAGLALETVDGGTTDGVVASNLVMSGVGTPVFIRLGNVGRRYTRGMDVPPPGAIRNVVISNVVARTNPEGDWRAGFAASITGLPGHPVEDVRLSSIRFQRIADGDGPPKVRDGTPNLDLPEVADKYPEYTMFGERMPSHGFYVRHVRGLTLEGIDVELDYPDERPALVVDRVDDLRVSDLRSNRCGGDVPLVVARDLNSARLDVEVGQLRLVGQHSDVRVRRDDAHVTVP